MTIAESPEDGVPDFREFNEKTSLSNRISAAFSGTIDDLMNFGSKMEPALLRPEPGETPDESPAAQRHFVALSGSNGSRPGDLLIWKVGAKINPSVFAQAVQTTPQAVPEAAPAFQKVATDNFVVYASDAKTGERVLRTQSFPDFGDKAVELQAMQTKLEKMGARLERDPLDSTKVYVAVPALNQTPGAEDGTMNLIAQTLQSEAPKGSGSQFKPTYKA